MRFIGYVIIGFMTSVLQFGSWAQKLTLIIGDAMSEVIRKWLTGCS